MTLATDDLLMELRDRLAPLRTELGNHSLYAEMSSIEDLRLFSESHVFAVWDFMSLLKALQQMLTCTKVPWLPTRSAASRRFINEIVLGEESDEFDGRCLSHFELYKQAMIELGADVRPIDRFVEALSNGRRIDDALQEAAAPEEASRFVQMTFTTIGQDKQHVVAAAFAFGREDVIPEMFRSLVESLSRRFPARLDTLLVYLQRHIDVDGDNHGPMALRMIAELCGEDQLRWDEAARAAEQALTARLEFWDAIQSRIISERRKMAVAR